MPSKFVSFVLNSRLENVMAATASAALLVFFLTTRLFHSFSLGLHDFMFILLPVGILGVKSLFELLVNSQAAEETDSVSLLTTFFRPLVKIIRDWFPFLVLSACYYALYTNLILRVNPRTADDVLAGIDRALFGHQLAFLLEPWSRPWLTDFFNLIYFSYVLFLPGVALSFYLRKQEAAFRRIMMGYLTLILMGVTSYLLVPAVGPGSHFADQFQRDLQGQLVSRGVDYVIHSGRVSHDCFPSLHVGIPLLLCLYLRNYRLKTFGISVGYVTLMCGATVYLRYHYVIDVIAAFAYAPAAYWLNDVLLTRWPGERALKAGTVAATQPPIAEPIAALTCSTNSRFPNSPLSSLVAPSPLAKPPKLASTASPRSMAASKPF